MNVLRLSRIGSPPFGRHPGVRGARYLPAILLFDSQNNDTGCGGHQENAHQAVHPGTVIAGLGQVKTLGVLYGQGNFGVSRTVVFQHGDVILVHGCGNGGVVVRQCPLGDIP